jgi:hypothetical protein
MNRLERFKPGQVYFIVMFHDEDLKIPVVQTLIFEKIGKRKNGSEFLLFRQIPPQGAESKFIVEKEHVEQLLLDEKGLVDKLKRSFDGKLASGAP